MKPPHSNSSPDSGDTDQLIDRLLTSQPVRTSPRFVEDTVQRAVAVRRRGTVVHYAFRAVGIAAALLLGAFLFLQTTGERPSSPGTAIAPPAAGEAETDFALELYQEEDFWAETILLLEGENFETLEFLVFN